MISSTVFLDGPFIRSAGDGVVPFSKGCEPFFRWKSKSDGNTFTTEEVEKDVGTLIENTLNTRDDWVGILGFSQGGRLAAGLLAEQEKEQEEDMYGDESGFKFGVFLMTPSPPMTSLVYEDGVLDKIQTPSVNVVGKQNQWYESSTKMHKEYFETAKLVEFDIGHRLPNVPADMTTIAREILGLYLQTTGIRRTLNQG